MSNSNSILIKARKQAAQLAKDVAKSGSRELLEIPKRAPAELVGKQDNRPSPIVEAMHDTSTFTPHTSVSGLKQIARLDQEMTRLRKMRDDEERKSRQTMLDQESNKISEPGKPLLPSSPQKGPKLNVTAKQTKMEAKPGRD